MVRIQNPVSDYDRLDALLRQLTAELGLHLEVTGWTRKTYTVWQRASRFDAGTLLAQVESFATTNGEIRVFDDAGLPFAERLGQALEEQFPVGEAVIQRVPRPR